MAFLPNDQTPWTGLIVASLEDGGFDIFNVDGMRIITASGPELSGLAAIPDFALRGENFPLMFGVDSEGAMRGFAAVLEAEDVLELPLEGDWPQDLIGLCHYNTGIGYVDLAVLTQDARAFIVRVRDAGGVGLQVSQQSEINLPFSADHCDSDIDHLVVSSPAAGLARVSMSEGAQAFRSEIGLGKVALASFLGRPFALTVSQDTGALTAYDFDTLEPYAVVNFESGLNAPRLQSPTAFAVNSESFGGMSFSSGLFVVYDAADNRVKLVAREVLARSVRASD